MSSKFKKILGNLKKTQVYNQAVLPKHYGSALAANLQHRFPARGMKIIGVTGTDGKTTTTMLIAQMLRSAGLKTASITTISVNYGDGQGEQPSPSHMTTASAASLMSMLDRVKAAGAEWLVLEVSSHSLSQYRVLGVPFSVAVMTNVTHEHLDYHGTFNRYVAAKTRLFKLVSRNKKGLQVGIINAEDPSARKFIQASAKPVTYGFERGDVHISELKLTDSGSEYTAITDSGSYNINCKLPGRFNVYNSLAAVCVGRAIGLSKAEIEKGIASLESVPGRMNKLKTETAYDVFVDYAVTPAALENVLKAARETTKGQVRIVFGATGDRDKEKRPVMGRIAAELADAIYLTDDETHTEDPASIQQAVLKGIKDAGGEGKTKQFADRGEAIQAALNDGGKGDSILITGLGHQTTRNMGGQDEPWSDSEFVLEMLKKS